MSRRALHIAGALGLVVAASALLGRVRPPTYDEAWRGLPLATASRDSLVAADGREVALTGYVVPLGVGWPERYLLTAFAPGCPFCRPGAGAATVEVVAREPPPAGDGPVVVRGTLAVRPDTARSGGAPALVLTAATARPAPTP